MKYKITFQNKVTYVTWGVKLDRALYDLTGRGVSANEIKIEIASRVEKVDINIIVHKEHDYRGKPDKHNGVVPPVKVRRSDNVLIDGYMRVRSAKEAGVKEILVEYIEE